MSLLGIATSQVQFPIEEKREEVEKALIKVDLEILAEEIKIAEKARQVLLARIPDRGTLFALKIHIDAAKEENRPIKDRKEDLETALDQLNGLLIRLATKEFKNPKSSISVSSVTSVLLDLFEGR